MTRFMRKYTRGNLDRDRGFTLVELMVASSIFIVLIGLLMTAVVGAFRSFGQGQKMAQREQRKRFVFFRLGKEISSITTITYPVAYFKGDEKSFFFVFNQEDNLLESGCAFNSTNHTLEHYSQQPPDYDSSTYQTKEAWLEGLSDCRFSYWDGMSWQTSWSQDKGGLPRMIKVNFKFSDETREQEFIVNIPISS